MIAVNVFMYFPNREENGSGHLPLPSDIGERKNQENCKSLAKKVKRMTGERGRGCASAWHMEGEWLTLGEWVQVGT